MGNPRRPSDTIPGTVNVAGFVLPTRGRGVEKSTSPCGQIFFRRSEMDNVTIDEELAELERAIDAKNRIYWEIFCATQGR